MTDYRMEAVRKHLPRNDDKEMGTLIAIADLVVSNTDGDGDWLDGIEGEVSEALQTLGLLVACDEGCNDALMVVGWGCQRDHPCTTCGYNDCECCSDCEIYPCVCCGTCGLPPDDCTCDVDGGLG